MHHIAVSISTPLRLGVMVELGKRGENPGVGEGVCIDWWILHLLDPNLNNFNLNNTHSLTHSGKGQEDFILVLHTVGMVLKKVRNQTLGLRESTSLLCTPYTVGW